MRIMVLGVGQQGRAAMYDLCRWGDITEVLAADRDMAGVGAWLEAQAWGRRVQRAAIDAGDLPAVDRLLTSFRPDLVVDLLPVTLHDGVVARAVAHGIHVVHASYVTPRQEALADQARARGVAILPEFGLDPGLDLVLLGEAVRGLEQVTDIRSYAAGFPERTAADNVLQYKVTWNLEGVLRSYRRPARVIRNGRVESIPAADIFAPANIHRLPLPGLGDLEAFANGDALRYLSVLNLVGTDLRHLGRYVLRWPGHTWLWKTLVDMGLLSEEPVVVDGRPVDRLRYLAALLAPQLSYGPQERDVAVVRVDVTGRRDGQPRRMVLQLTDHRDLDTGLSAMSRTVGFTAAIGARLILDGRITRRGVLSAVRDVPFAPLEMELARQGIHVIRHDSCLD
ncbi:MAG: saccharopine dehydrogenase NADP-binding domain-containing protein [Acidobacteria bacterium]|nr:saccharopine dehydrogenase NADP-binding domain-containing protein [Acidobacteriota bacterium]